MQTATSPKGLKLLSTNEVCEIFGVSEDTLWRRRKDGYFVEGYHYIRIGTLKRSQFRWHHDRTLEVFTFCKQPTKQVLEIAKQAQILGQVIIGNTPCMQKQHLYLLSHTFSNKSLISLKINRRTVYIL